MTTQRMLSLRRKKKTTLQPPAGDSPVAPWRLAMYSYLIFLLALIFPPGLYTRYIHEPDLMFMDPLLFLFYSACVLAFLAGLKIAGSLFTPTRSEGTTVGRLLSLVTVCMPVLLGTLWAGA